MRGAQYLMFLGTQIMYNAIKFLVEFIFTPNNMYFIGGN